MHHYRPDFQPISVQNSTIIVFAFGSSSGHCSVKEAGGSISLKRRGYFWWFHRRQSIWWAKLRHEEPHLITWWRADWTKTKKERKWVPRLAAQQGWLQPTGVTTPQEMSHTLKHDKGKLVTHDTAGRPATDCTLRCLLSCLCVASGRDSRSVTPAYPRPSISIGTDGWQPAVLRDSRSTPSQRPKLHSLLTSKYSVCDCFMLKYSVWWYRN